MFALDSGCGMNDVCCEGGLGHFSQPAIIGNRGRRSRDYPWYLVLVNDHLQLRKHIGSRGKVGKVSPAFPTLKKKNRDVFVRVSIQHALKPLEANRVPRRLMLFHLLQD